MHRHIPRLFSCILLLSLLFGCKDKMGTASETDVASMSAEKESVPFPYAGDWIRQDYLERIRTTYSPRLAQENIEACYIRIPAFTQQSTSMIYNFHEASAELVTMDENGRFILREKNSDGTLASALRMEPLGPDTLKIEENTFVRIHPETENQQPLILEEILFKGRYTTPKGEVVEFKNNGEVTGLEGYQYYTPVIDYFDAGLQIDQVGLGQTRSGLTYYGFKRKGVNLDLFEIKCITFDQQENRCVEVDYGKKAYSFTLAED